MAVLKITLQIWVVERKQGSSCSQAAQSSPPCPSNCIIGSITRGLYLDGQTLKHSHPLALGRLDRQMAPTERWVRKMQGGIFSPRGCCQVLQSTRGALRSRSKASPPGSSEEKHFLSSAKNLTRGVTTGTRFPVELRICLCPFWLSYCVSPRDNQFAWDGFEHLLAPSTSNAWKYSNSHCSLLLGVFSVKNPKNKSERKIYTRPPTLKHTQNACQLLLTSCRFQWLKIEELQEGKSTIDSDTYVHRNCETANYKVFYNLKWHYCEQIIPKYLKIWLMSTSTKKGDTVKVKINKRT